MEALQLGPRDSTTIPKIEEAQRKFTYHKEKYDRLRGDVAIKLKFLEENKVGDTVLVAHVNRTLAMEFCFLISGWCFMSYCLKVAFCNRYPLLLFLYINLLSIAKIVYYRKKASIQAWGGAL